jgi:hypothetical protein
MSRQTPYSGSLDGIGRLWALRALGYIPAALINIGLILHGVYAPLLLRRSGHPPLPCLAINWQKVLELEQKQIAISTG